VNDTQRRLRAIEALATRQLGCFSRGQATDLGVTLRVLQYRARAGEWPIVLPGVHRVAAVSPGRDQLAMAAALWSAPDGLVSHTTAAMLWGFEGITAETVHVTVPTARRVRTEQVTVHHTADLLPADVSRVGPIPVTSPLRTAIDLAAAVQPDVLEIAIESALRRRQFSVGQLRWRAEALTGKGRPGSTTLRRLLASRVLGGTDSGWEVRAIQVLRAAGLPEPVRQYEVRVGRIRVATPDLAYPDAHVAIEYDSDEWHHGVARRQHDIERRNRLRAAGWTVVEVSAAQLRAPDVFLAAVRAAVDQVGGPARRNSLR
jgi:hypothetical protein